MTAEALGRQEQNKLHPANQEDIEFFEQLLQKADRGIRANIDGPNIWFQLGKTSDGRISLTFSDKYPSSNNSYYFIDPYTEGPKVQIQSSYYPTLEIPANKTNVRVTSHPTPTHRKDFFVVQEDEVRLITHLAELVRAINTDPSQNNDALNRLLYQEASQSIFRFDQAKSREWSLLHARAMVADLLRSDYFKAESWLDSLVRARHGDFKGLSFYLEEGALTLQRISNDLEHAIIARNIREISKSII